MTNTTTHITTSGGLISAAFIEQIREADARLRGLAPETFKSSLKSPPTWRRASPTPGSGRWSAGTRCTRRSTAMDVSTVRQRWLLPLFELLDFEPTYLRGDVVLDEAGKLRYPLSHRGWPDDAIRRCCHSTVAP